MGIFPRVQRWNVAYKTTPRYGRKREDTSVSPAAVPQYSSVLVIIEAFNAAPFVKFLVKWIFAIGCAAAEGFIVH